MNYFYITQFCHDNYDGDNDIGSDGEDNHDDDHDGQPPEHRDKRQHRPNQLWRGF